MITAELKHWIKIFRRNTFKSEFGQLKEKYGLISKVKAGVKYLSHNEGEENHQIKNKHKIRFKIRFKRGLRETDIIQFYDDYYNITFVEPTSDRLVIFLHAELITEKIVIDGE